MAGQYGGTACLLLLSPVCGPSPLPVVGEGGGGGTLLYNSRYRPRGPGSTFPIKKVTHAVIEPGAAIAKERERTIQDK